MILQNLNRPKKEEDKETALTFSKKINFCPLTTKHRHSLKSKCSLSNNEQMFMPLTTNLRVLNRKLRNLTQIRSTEKLL